MKQVKFLWYSKIEMGHTLKVKRFDLVGDNTFLYKSRYPRGIQERERERERERE